MKILTLDLATKTGWCFGHYDEPLLDSRHGVIDFSLGKGETRGHRFLKFHTWFRQLVKSQKPDRVYYEDVKRHSSNLSARVYCGLLSQVEMICAYEKIPLFDVGVGTIKKHATGKGNATKEMMIDACKVKGITPKDDNEADAICLWCYAVEEVHKCDF